MVCCDSYNAKRRNLHDVHTNDVLKSLTTIPVDGDDEDCARRARAILQRMQEKRRELSLNIAETSSSQSPITSHCEHTRNSTGDHSERTRSSTGISFSICPEQHDFYAQQLDSRLRQRRMILSRLNPKKSHATSRKISQRKTWRDEYSDSVTIATMLSGDESSAPGTPDVTLQAVDDAALHVPVVDVVPCNAEIEFVEERVDI